MTTKKVIHTTSGMELLRRLAEDGKRIITLDDARSYSAAAGISQSYLRQAFHYLEQGGWVRRLRPGLYAISPPLINAPIHEFEVAMYLVKDAAISHWSAMSYHALTDQIPRTVFVLTSDAVAAKQRGSPSEPYQVWGIRYVFVQVKPDRFFGTQQEWFGESRVLITDLERTLLDGLTRPAYCGGFAEVATAFESSIDRIDIDKIIAYALKLDVATVRRLGWMLEKSGIDSTKLEPLLKSSHGEGYRPLDPTRPTGGPCNSHWGIRENLQQLV